MLDLDRLDRQILSLLDQNGRFSVAEIARHLNVSRQLVNVRLKKLEANNAILGYYTIFDSGKVGYYIYRALVRLLNISPQQREEILAYLQHHPHIMWLGEIGGSWDIMMNFICRGHIDFNEIAEEISEKFGAFINKMEILVYVDIHDYSRSYLDPEYPVRKEFYHRMQEDKSIELDDLDRNIIGMISTNARIEYTALGNQLQVSRNTVKKRIDQLIQNKVILGFRAFPNIAEIGYQSHVLLLEITKLDPERETELYYFLQMIPQVTFVVKHLERWKVSVEIETVSNREYQEILQKIRSNFSDIISDYDTFPLLKDLVVNYFPKGILEQG